MKRIVPKKSVIVAADVTTRFALESLSKAMKGLSGIGGFKLGFTLGLQDLGRSVDIARRSLGPEFPMIYDHQKGGNDIPKMGEGFAEVLRNSGVDAAILFPFAGPATQEIWTKACFEAGLQVITGGIMTHPQFLVSEGGYIADEAVEKIYRNAACSFGCTHFVVPGTKIDWVKRIRGWLVNDLGEGNFVLYSPGLITQGGDVSECGRAAGNEWHAIVGSAIYEQPTVEAQRQAAIAVTSQVTTEPV